MPKSFLRCCLTQGEQFRTFSQCRMTRTYLKRSWNNPSKRNTKLYLYVCVCPSFCMTDFILFIDVNCVFTEIRTTRNVWFYLLSPVHLIMWYLLFPLPVFHIFCTSFCWIWKVLCILYRKPRMNTSKWIKIIERK